MTDTELEELKAGLAEISPLGKRGRAYFNPDKIASLIARLEAAEGRSAQRAEEPPVRDGYPSKIEWIRAYRAKHNAPLKDAKEAYENGTPLNGAPATFEVYQDGTPVAMASGPRDRAYAEAMHYAAVYGQDGPVEVFELVPVSLPAPPAKSEG